MKQNNRLQNTVLEIVMLISTVVLAALLGNYVAGVTTRQMPNLPSKLVTDTLIGLGVGISTSISIRYIWVRMQLIFTKWQEHKDII